MCGIAGSIHYKNDKPISEALIRRMISVLEHRGPDDEGVYLSPATGRRTMAVGLGHRRLSIIDLSAAGHQPMSNEDGTVWVVLNGEIYNFKELRKLCEEKGHRFHSHSDTEVVVHLYEEYGPDMVKHLRGMFAFTLWDERRERFLLARDRMGQKPLFYLQANGRLLFGSEIKAILQDENYVAEVNREALDDYLMYSYVPAPKTMFQGIKKIPPAHMLIGDANGIRLERYWRLSFNRQERLSESAWCERIMAELTEATKIRLVSDVPLGAFLSGGIDSSAIVGIMSSLMDRPVKTFSIGFDEAVYNELQYADLVAQQFATEHHRYIIRPNVLEILPKLIWHYNEPYADSSAIPTYYLAQVTREHVTVALSGDAGDENFAGYKRYVAHKLAAGYEKIPSLIRDHMLRPMIERLDSPGAARTVVYRLKRFLGAMVCEPRMRHAYWMETFNDKHKHALYTDAMAASLEGYKSADYLCNFFEEFDGTDFIDAVLYVDLMSYLPEDLLVKVDIATMAHSLETRSPFLDHKVVETAAMIPATLKLKGIRTKHILKKALEPLLPHQILHRGKMGFGIPIGSWFKGQWSGFLREIFTDAAVVRAGYLQKEAVHHLLEAHSTGQANHDWRIWNLLNFELWYRMFIAGDDLSGEDFCKAVEKSS